MANVDKSPCVSGRATPEIVEDPATPAANKSFRAKEPERNGQEMYEKERGGQKPKINVVVIGHVDAGKSTLMGHLLCDLNHVSQRTMHKYEQESKKLGKQSFMYAWVLDETEEERNRGITMDVGAYHFETDNKMVRRWLPQFVIILIHLNSSLGDDSRRTWSQGLYPQHDHRSYSSGRRPTSGGRH